MKELQEALNKSAEILSNYKDAIKNVANYNYKTIPGLAIAIPKKSEKAKKRQKKKLVNIIPC